MIYFFSLCCPEISGQHKISSAAWKFPGSPKFLLGSRGKKRKFPGSRGKEIDFFFSPLFGST